MVRQQNRVTLVCQQCGKEFEVKASLANQRFCSRKCQFAGKKEVVVCEQCGESFEAYKKAKRRFCSKSCAITAKNLTDQNPCYQRDISGEKNPMYGKGLKGEENGMYGRTREQNPAFKGGRKVRPDGYIMILAPDDHPARSNPYPYVLEHRLIMEQHLGRYLTEEEVVHHVDGNPSNNDIENLRLFANQSDHISIGHG